jgi:pyrroloquinoline quinone biosynthesis protein B
MGRLSAFILGSAAGGGFPQWNCGCEVCRLAWAGDPRVKPRTQASIAVTAGSLNHVAADGAHAESAAPFVLINASPDLRQQILDCPALQPRGLQKARLPPWC